MSVTRAELETMDRDDLVDVILELSGRLDDLEMRADGATTKRQDLQERIWELEEEVEDLEATVAELQGRVDPNPASKTYQEKDRPELVQELRVALCRRAMSNGGKAAMDYNNVLSLFNEHPSDGYAYKLMKLAADYDAETKQSRYPGFTYVSRDDKNDQIRVKTEAVKDEAVLHAVKNDRSDMGGS